MVGGGVLVKTLIGINYETSVVVVGVLMLAMCCSAAWSRRPGCRSSRRCCW
jgi:hypothetical protein